MAQAAEKANEKPCLVCGEAIKLAAKKCIHCDSFQNWRDALPTSSTVLSLLVALVGICTAAIPVLKNALTPAKSDLTFHYQSASSAALSSFISNAGIRPGSVSGAWLLVDEPGSPELADTVELKIEQGGKLLDAVVIGPGQSKLVAFTPSDSEFGGKFHHNTALRLLAAKKNNCVLQYEFTNFPDKQGDLKEPIPCDQLSGLAGAHYQEIQPPVPQH